jgi:pimeloyl-ACP methyl ester carboxylesterase
MSDEYETRISITGEGPPLVLVPGMDGTGRLFYRQVPLLSRRYRVATYALRDDTSDMSRLVSDLALVIDAIAPVERRALVVGESFGGALALSLALAMPDKVSGLVVLNSFPFFAPQWRLRLAILGLGLIPWGAMKLVRRATAWRLHSRHTHHDDIARFMELTAQATRRGYLNRLRALRQYDARERLNEICSPTLFLAAEQDHLVPSVTQAEYMRARVPGAVTRVLPGHGHICLIAPGVDLAAILQEWASSSPTAASLFAGARRETP